MQVPIAFIAQMLGSWDPQRAVPGIIRHDLGFPDERGVLSVVHATDSPEAFERENAFLFNLQVDRTLS